MGIRNIENDGPKDKERPRQITSARNLRAPSRCPSGTPAFPEGQSEPVAAAGELNNGGSEVKNSLCIETAAQVCGSASDGEGSPQGCPRGLSTLFTNPVIFALIKETSVGLCREQRVGQLEKRKKALKRTSVELHFRVAVTGNLRQGTCNTKNARSVGSEAWNLVLVR